MKLVTYNIRNQYTADGVNSFLHRSGLILDTIREEAPDIICFQEMIPESISFLRRHLAPDYTLIHTQREDGLSGEGSAVAYRPEKFSLYGLDIFWLSPTPQTVASRFPGQSRHSRICQRLLFKNEQTGNVFKIYNVHLEERSEDVRALQAELVLSRLAEETLPCFLLGDMNSQPDGKVLPLCQAQGLVDLTDGIPVTFHRFGKPEPGIKLDYIFTDPDTARRCGNVRIWDACVNGIYLSDHYPIELICDL